MAFEDVKEKLFGAIQKSKKGDQIKGQGVDEARLCAFVKGRVEESRSFASRISHEGIWLTNIAYVLGFDSVFYDVNMRQFRPVNYPGQFMRRNRISVNRILPTLQNRAARLTKNPPRYDTRPKSNSENDKDASRLGLQIINQVWDAQQINKKRLELVMWVQQCGHAYLKTCWDKTLGPKMPYQDEQTGEVKLMALGDIRVDVVNAFEVFPDNMAKSFEELNYITQAKIRPIHYFREHFGEVGRRVEAEDVWLTSLQYENRINTFNNQAGAATGVNNLVKNSAIEISYYERPSYKFPQGRMIIIANGVVLKDDVLPIDEIPFSKFDDVMVAGKYYSESIVTHMRPIQDQYNRVLSLRADWQNKLLAGKYMAARGHGLMKEALNDQSGEVVEYDHVPNCPPPQAMQIPLVPQYAYTEDDYLNRAMDNIAGLSEPSQGELPSASIPAIGLQYLVEQDMTRIGVVTEQHEYAYAATGRQILKFAENHYDVPRTLKIAGKGSEYMVKEFRGAEIEGNNDVIVIRGSTLPGSKVLRRQEIINLHQGGYLGNPQDPKVLENVLEMLEFGDIAEVWEDHSLDMGQIKKHIDMIEEGLKPPVSEFDNHALFIKELNRYRKSDKFDLLSPQAQMVLLETMEAHVQEMINMAAPGGETDPTLAPQTGAQEMQSELEQQMGLAPGEMPEAPPPPPADETEPMNGGI